MTAAGIRLWFQCDDLDRFDGYAVSGPDGATDWYLRGQRVPATHINLALAQPAPASRRRSPPPRP